MAGGATGFEDLRGYSAPTTAGGATGFEDLAVKPKEKGIVDRAGEQLNRTLTNMKNTVTDWGEGVSKAIDNVERETVNSAGVAYNAIQNGQDYDPERPLTGYETEGYDRARKDLYNQSVGKPAMYLAVTPKVPATVRGAAGIIAAPTIIDETVTGYNANRDAGQGMAEAAGNTLFDTAIAPVVTPAKKLISSPGDFAQGLVDNPFNTWDDVFMPAALIHGTAKGVEAMTPDAIKRPITDRVNAVTDRARDAANPIITKLDNVRQRFTGGKTGFEDLAPDNTADGFSDLAPERSLAEETAGPDMRQNVYARLKAKGYTDAEVSGIVGNIEGESSFDTKALSNDGNGSRGLVQWTGPRLQDLKDFAAEQGADPFDWRTQVDFIDHELKGKERGALEKLRENPDMTPEEAAYLVRKWYERPDESVARDAVRQEAARKAYDNRGNVQEIRETAADEPFRAQEVDTGEVQPANLNLDELTKKIDAGDLPTKDLAAYDDARNIQEKALATKNSITDLQNGITDQQGNPVKVPVDGDMLRQLSDLVDEKATALDKRSVAASVLTDTVKHPDLVLNHTDGGKSYVSYMRTPDSSVHQVTVQTGKQGTSVRVDMKTSIPDMRRVESASLRGDGVSYMADGVRSYMADGARIDAADTAFTRDSVKNEAPVTRQEIMDAVDTLFTKVKTGRIGKKSALGWFNRTTGVIRSRRFADPRIIGHELGHFLDKTFRFSSDPTFHKEFHTVVKQRFGKYYNKLNAEGQAGEGFAEFFHDYTTNRPRVKASFPTFYDKFNEAMKENPVYAEKVNKLSHVFHKWYQQEPWEREKGAISFYEGNKLTNTVQDLLDKDSVKAKLHDLYTKVVDENHPLLQVISEIEKATGRKFPVEANPFLQAWLSRGWMGKAETLIEHGVPEAGVKPLAEIMRSVGEKAHKDFSTYLVALRDLDIIKWNKTNPADPIYSVKAPADVGATIAHYSANKVFVQAAKDLQKFQDYMLAQLVNEGMVKIEAVAEMKKKYPNYVPFMREFSDAGVENFMGSRSFINVADPIKKMKGSDKNIVDPLETIGRNVFKFTNAIERNHVGKVFADLSLIEGMGNIVERVKGAAGAKDSSFTIWRNGKKEVYNTTPQMYEMLKNMNKESANMVTQVLGKPASLLRAGATALSPEFVFRNLARDMITAGLFSKNGFIPVVDSFKGLMLYLKKGDLYWDYMKSGAAHSAMVSLDRDYMGGSIRKMMKDPSVLREIANPLDVLRALSEATEMATRLAEFDNAKKGYTGVFNRLFSDERNPLSDSEAALAARDITIDFGRIGSKTKSVNRTVAFFNAALQGTDKLARSFKENPADMTIKTFTAITLPSIALWYLNKDNPAYQELPQWQKDIYWIIPAGDTLIKLPKPFEPGVAFGTAFERMLQYTYDKENNTNGVGFKGLGKSLADALLPNIFPTALLPVAEWVANYSAFMDRDIVPQNQQNLPARLQYGPNTSSIGRAVGNALDVSPYKVDNTIRGYTGGLGRLAMDAADAASGLSDTRPAKKWTEQAFVRGFTATPYAQSDSINRVYDDFNQQNSLREGEKLTGERSPDFDQKQYEKLKATTEALKTLNKATKAIRDSDQIDAETKRKRLDAIQLKKVDIARRALGLSKISE